MGSVIYLHDVNHELLHHSPLGIQAIATATIGGETVKMESRGEMRKEKVPT